MRARDYIRRGSDASASAENPCQLRPGRGARGAERAVVLEDDERGHCEGGAGRGVEKPVSPKQLSRYQKLRSHMPVILCAGRKGARARKLNACNDIGICACKGGGGKSTPAFAFKPPTYLPLVGLSPTHTLSTPACSRFAQPRSTPTPTTPIESRHPQGAPRLGEGIQHLQQPQLMAGTWRGG